eukprot:s1438_g6.t1
MAAPSKMEAATPLGRVEIPLASKSDAADKEIYWHSTHWSWQERGTAEKAKAKALKDARNYRDQVLASSDPELKQTEPKDATGPTSTTRGVGWCKSKRKWVVQISRVIDGKRKRIPGGFPDDKEKAEAKAAKLALTRGERGAKVVAKGSPGARQNSCGEPKYKPPVAIYNSEPSQKITPRRSLRDLSMRHSSGCNKKKRKLRKTKLPQSFKSNGFGGNHGQRGLGLGDV